MPHINEEQLSAFLDRQLDVCENSFVETHVRECKSCRSLLEEMRALTYLFKDAERLKPSPFLWTRIAAGFEQENRKSSSGRGRVASVLAGMRRFGLNSGLAAAAFGILMFIGISIFREPNLNPAALAEIDRTYRSLAAEDPDAYNPFSSSSPSSFDVNPFRSVRLSGKTHSAPLKNLQR
jgi:hypothetical protein